MSCPAPAGQQTLAPRDERKEQRLRRLQAVEAALLDLQQRIPALAREVAAIREEMESASACAISGGVA